MCSTILWPRNVSSRWLGRVRGSALSTALDLPASWTRMEPELTPPARRLRRVTSAPTTLATSSSTSSGTSACSMLASLARHIEPRLTYRSSANPVNRRVSLTRTGCGSAAGGQCLRTPFLVRNPPDEDVPESVQNSAQYGRPIASFEHLRCYWTCEEPNA